MCVHSPELPSGKRMWATKQARIPLQDRRQELKFDHCVAAAYLLAESVIARIKLAAFDLTA